MKTFEPEELVNLLHSCSIRLHDAYQATQDDDLWMMSREAHQASHWILCEIHRKNNHVVH